MRIRKASADDVRAIVELRRDAAAWLASIGSDQWSSAGLGDTEFTRRVHESIAAGETWIALSEADQVIGTIAIDHHSSPGLWSPEELQDSLVIHRMIKSRNAPGVGAALLEHAEQVAREHGASYLRLDAWTTNVALHRYYRHAGFEHVRTVAGHHTPSAALFARKIA